MQIELKKGGKIENWSFQILMADEYKAPEQGTVVVVGKIYYDVRACDGTQIRTSRIERISLDESLLLTKNTIYELGNIDSQFLKYMADNNYTIDEYAKNINR